MRLDPLTEAWTIFSEARPISPAFGSRRAGAKGASPFTAGHEQHAAQTLFTTPAQTEGWQVRLVPNRAPILRVQGDATRRSDGFYDRMDSVGAHEIIIEDPGSEALAKSANEGDESSKENAGKYSDLRVNSSPGALRAYRESVAAPLFLDRAR